ncbi:MAG: transglutaminase family protein [Verrucomicrobia bacterium]|nr:transglutaminase family protein [Verrucomicrobiota bacterium]
MPATRTRRSRLEGTEPTDAPPPPSSAAAMLFEIVHETAYQNAAPASEAYLELRLHPPDTPHQTVLQRRLHLDPSAPTSAFEDYFGNRAEFFSLPSRHQSLLIRNELLVRTHPQPPPAEALGVSVQEARQIFASAGDLVFDYLQPTELIPQSREAHQWARRHLPARLELGPGLLALNHAVFAAFRYESGATDTSTPLETLWTQRRGVCQDFSHILLSVLRSAGLPARYVCGYIETDPPPARSGTPRRRLIGSVATHAWVEVLLPGLHWYALDPTNDKPCDERHVAMSIGRDFRDASPVRGTFKGSSGQRLKVRVQMRRRSERAGTPLAAVTTPS